jgi:dihydroxyacetone kinase-like protein
VEHLLNKITTDLPFGSGDEVAVMVNGLGATPLMELYIANRKVAEMLAEKNIAVAKTYVGNFMTSLEMAGFSITLLKLDEELKQLLLAPADTPALVQV